ncbi:MAG: BamA/TamA family outer membrane protein [Bacteroidia bacterium]|nr:BamA/TamA family outer membrane protein [Bacteroidia bacterium]
MFFKSVLFFVFLGFVLTINSQNLDSAFKVERISIEGNNKTKASIILRELTFGVGDTIQNWNFHSEQSRKQLINLFLFNEIQISHLKGEVKIIVTERWYFWPIPVLEYADRNFNQWWLTKDPKRLIYGVDLSWYNLRGRNETMVLDLVLGYTKAVGLSYRMPFINKKKTWGVQLKAQLNTNREVWYATKDDKVLFFKDNDVELITRKLGEVIVTHRKKFFSYHNFYTGFRQIEVKDTIITKSVNERYLMNGQTNQKEAYVGYQYLYDRRDFKGFPLSGHLLKVNLEASNFFFKFKDFQTLMLKAAYSRYLPLGGRFFGSIHGTARWYSNYTPQYTHAQALGYGKDYIRGYELNVIDGNHFLLGKSELKYRFHNKKYSFMKKMKNYEEVPVAMYFSTYFDAGFVLNESQKDGLLMANSLPNTWQYGGGIVYNLVLYYDYCFRLEYSMDIYLNKRFYISFVASM